MLSTADRKRDRTLSGRLTAFAKRGGFSAALLGVALTAPGISPVLAAPSASATPAAPASHVVRVRMHDIAFVPQMLAVASGTTIEWTNDDDMAHTVTSGTDRDDDTWTSSPPIPPGGTFTIVLRKPGTYHYFCKPHVYSPAMHATIVVKADGN